MGDQLRFVDDSGDTRLAGELVDDGATVGDVLTVQSDGSLAAAAGGGSSSVVAGQYGASLVTIAPSTWTNPDWVKIDGASLLDLTDPANPVALAAGYYNVSLEAQFNGASGEETGKSGYVEIDIDLNGADANVATNFSLDPSMRAGLSQINQALSVEAFCPVGGVINFAVQHNLSADATAFAWHAYLNFRAQETA